MTKPVAVELCCHATALIYVAAARMFPTWFKSLTVVHLLMGYIYLASGFIVSFLLLIGMVIWPFNKNLYRKYAFYLTYAQWSRKYHFSPLCNVCFYFCLSLVTRTLFFGFPSNQARLLNIDAVLGGYTVFSLSVILSLCHSVIP